MKKLTEKKLIYWMEGGKEGMASFYRGASYRRPKNEIKMINRCDII